MRQFSLPSPRPLQVLLGLLLTIGVAGPYLSAAEEANADKSASQLEMFTQFNSRCQGLMRGDIRMVRNTADKTIEYLMVRMLAGKRQASLIRDQIEPGEDHAQKLGCERLGDQEQTWEVLRAEYVEE